MASDYVADTHSLLWFLSGSGSLSTSARDVFRAARGGGAAIFVPVIVVAELIWVIRDTHLEINLPKLLATVRANYAVVPLTIDDVSHLPDLPEGLEMHDRMIVWETLKRKATLITRDRAIRRAGVVPILW